MKDAKKLAEHLNIMLNTDAEIFSDHFNVH